MKQWEEREKFGECRQIDSRIDRQIDRQLEEANPTVILIGIHRVCTICLIGHSRSLSSCLNDEVVSWESQVEKRCEDDWCASDVKVTRKLWKSIWRVWRVFRWSLQDEDRNYRRWLSKLPYESNSVSWKFSAIACQRNFQDLPKVLPSDFEEKSFDETFLETL